MNYSRGFRPPYAGGLLTTQNSNKFKNKNLTFQLLFNKISKLKSLSKNSEKSRDLLQKYSDKNSIKEVTIQMMNALENTINKTIEDFLKNSKRN